MDEQSRAAVWKSQYQSARGLGKHTGLYSPQGLPLYFNVSTFVQDEI